MSSESFYELGCSYMGHDIKKSVIVGTRRFKSFFGMSPNICSMIWSLLKEKMPSESKPKHILWCLFFLKQYTVEHVRRTVFDTDEKTVRNWSWIFVELLADLNTVYIIRSTQLV